VISSCCPRPTRSAGAGKFCPFFEDEHRGENTGRSPGMATAVEVDPLDQPGSFAPGGGGRLAQLLRAVYMGRAPLQYWPIDRPVVPGVTGCRNEPAGIQVLPH